MTDLSRRNALRLAGLGAVTTAFGAVGTWRTTVGSESQPAGTSGTVLVEPQVLTSSGGRLDVELVAGRGVEIAGRDTDALGYNGSSPGPTIRVRPGDTLRVRLSNRLDQTTNLHTHGLHVSPEGKSDDVFRSVEPGTTADYEFRIPEDHPPGTFWYHPHMHGMVADQVFGGLFGALIVAADEEPDVTERLLIVSDITLTSAGLPAPPGMPDLMMGREGDLVLVNGQHQPRIDVPAGTVERWRVINACVSRFLRLQLDGQDLGILGYDGQALGQPTAMESVTLAPGNRVDLVVKAPAAGVVTLRSLAVDRGGMGMMGGASGENTLAEVRIGMSDASPPTGSSEPTWTTSPTVDLRGRDVDETRRITFTMEMGMGMGMGGGDASFGFDGRAFDADRVDQAPKLGTVEEWTIANATPMDHPFHLHVWPMQLVAPESDATRDGPPDWRDVVIVPANGEVRVRIAFTDFPGRTVYHCHILDHEDQGMMGIVEAAT
jgi:FtsP/CotA-like multicopper oxidase with cupredoxin domain